MTIKGPDITSDLLLDISKFNKGANLASANLKKSLGGMTKNVGGFAKTMDSKGRQISGSWWKRFGTVALGFTIAYRAMNLFENGLMKLGATFKEAILQSGQLAEQQAKNAFWMTIFADEALSFSDAFGRAASSINALREESVRSISSIDELTTGIDELAQAGLPITKNLIPQMVSLVDFTGMVAQTVGSTTRQIRQELQALMDGTTRVTNQLVRVLTNMGVLTRNNLRDLKLMVNRAEIFEKVVGEIHDRWLAMVDTLIRSSPERAFSYWEKSIQKVLVQAVLLASELRGVDNLFGETLFRAAKRFREGIDKADMARLVYFIGLLNDGLGFLINLFNKSVTAVASLATASGNLVRELSGVWGFLGDVTAIVLTIKALQLLGKTMLWLVAGPAKALAKVVLLAFSPFILAAAVMGAAIILVVGQITTHLDVLKDAWQDLKDSFNSMLEATLVGLRAIKKDLESLLDKMNIVKNWNKEFEATKRLREQSEWSKRFQGWGEVPKRQLFRYPIIEPEEAGGKSLIAKAKDLILDEVKSQVDAFKEGLRILREATDPHVKKFMDWFDKLFDAPGLPDISGIGEDITTLFKKVLPKLILDDLKKMEREMKRFSDATPAFLTTLDALKKGFLLPEDVTEYMNLQKILEAHSRVITALNAQMDFLDMDKFRWEEYLDFKKIADDWKEIALGHNDAKFSLKLYLTQLKLLKDVQDDYNNLVMTGSEYRLWSLDKEIEDLRALAIGNEELLALLEKYSIVRRESLENEFSGMAKLAEDIAQSMENSFSDLFFDVMTLEWKSLGDLAENTLRAMQRALADFLAQAAQAAIMGEQTGGGGWVGGILSAFFNNFFKSGGGGGGDYGYMGTYHQGGIVGAGNVPTKVMPLSLLENAVRLHSGLRGDEYPAILQRGEKVYPKGESPIDSVTIINNTSFTPEVTETRRSGGGKDIQIIIGEMLAKDVYQGGPLNQALKVTYGLRPQTIRR